MELETVKIDLGDKDYAVIYKDVLRRTARLHEAELRQYMTPAKKMEKVLLSDLEKLDTMPSVDYLIDMENIDNDAINEIFILNQVVEWTLGDISHDTIDNKMTREQYAALVKAMDGLYKPVPLAEGAS